MTIPPTLQSLIDLMGSEMRAAAAHRLSAARRRQFYDLLNASDDPAIRHAHQWLALLTAQQVLPIFQAVYPDDDFPHTVLATARRVLQGAISDADVAGIEDHAYHASGNYWGYDERECPWNVGFAADSTYHALKEVRGYQPLRSLGGYQKLGIVHWPLASFEEEPQFMPYAQPVSGDSFTDEDVCQTSDSDTAAAAVVAFACNEFGPPCDPNKQEIFWTWLTEAIPAAMKAGQPR